MKGEVTPPKKYNDYDEIQKFMCFGTSNITTSIWLQPDDNRRGA